MVEKFLSRTVFTSQEDYIRNFRIRVPADFNFAYDVVDAYAAEEPDKKALLWTDDRGGEIQFTFADMKRETDRTASYFQSLGIGRGDMVMLILKRRYEFWFSILALHKLGAVAIPATHLLTRKDVVYRCNMAGIKAIVAAGEPVITGHIAAAMPESPTTKLLISVGPEVPEGFLDFHEGIRHAAPFVRPQHVNTNDDIMLMYFTSGTTGEPKMVAHDFTYPLGHISTGCFWHNLHEGSLHLTIADTGWAKAAWGKLYGQWLAGANIFVYDHEKFTPADILRKIGQYRITSLCAAYDLPFPDSRRPFEIRPFVAGVLYDRRRGAQRCRLRHVQTPDRRPSDGGFRADRNDADPRHLSVDGAQARQHGRAQPPVRYRSLDA